jgi:lipopolysaccharide/colanic/teichoic acid biosynthesis glycosyltransferase
MRFAYLRLVTWPLLDRRVAIVGADEAAIRSAEAIKAAAGAVPYRVVAFVAPVGTTSHLLGVPVLDPSHDLWSTLRELDIDLIVVGHTQGLSPNVLTELVRCFEQGVEALPATVLYEQLTGRVMVSALEADWYAELPTRVSGPYVAFKRVVDVVVSTIGLLAFPIWILVALAVIIDSGRPVLIRQIRIGQRGERFVIHKFRTMAKDAEEHGAPLWSTPNDPRCTRVGHALRRVHVDEVPQLWDVLRGRMSLIGPRPERPEFVDRLVSALPLYHARALVKPGITGWAQVLFPYAGSVDQSLVKLEFDLYYVRHFGALLDLSIALRTIALILGLAKPDYPEPVASTR